VENHDVIFSKHQSKAPKNYSVFKNFLFNYFS
jgi:hypothetical protein